MNKYDIAIIGAGAAGSMAAIWASKNGKSVVLIERNQQIGRKILATGNGRCNITNLKASSKNYFGAPSSFVDSVLKQFDPKDAIKYFESLGIILKEEDNSRIFPRNNQAESVVSALSEEITRSNIDLKLNSLARRIEKNDNWHVKLDSGEEIISEELIVTTGGKSSHQFGSSGDGYFWAEKLGHKIVPTFPALTPIEIKENWVKMAQGIKLEGRVSVILNDKEINSKTGDLIFTHFGVSGPAVMAQARFIAPLIGKNVKLHIDLYPDRDFKSLLTSLNSIIDVNGAKSIKNCLGGMIPNNLANLIIENLEINPDKKSAEISKIDREKIIKTLKNIELTPIQTRSFKESQVTRGGIDSAEINQETLESKIVAGLYFAGEIIDVDGESGGFNLQWAWSSGYVAGVSASK
jgi:hypothetical protein